MSTRRRAPWRAPWLELDVALARGGRDVGSSARQVLARVLDVIEPWRARGTLRCFYFMRKPPDLRMRFQCRGDTEPLAAVLEPALRDLEREGAVAAFFRGVYEPEERLFGGPHAMAHVHAFFDADTAAWFDLDRALRSGARGHADADVVLAVANDLFWRTLHGDGAQVWDTWCNLAACLPAPEGSAATDGAAIVSLDELIARSEGTARDGLQRYARATRTLADGLDRVRVEGRLTCGLRAILPFVAQFHFHRWGLDGARQARLARAMTAAWDPRRGMRGTQPDASGAGAAETGDVGGAV